MLWGGAMLIFGYLKVRPMIRRVIQCGGSMHCQPDQCPSFAEPLACYRYFTNKSRYCAATKGCLQRIKSLFPSACIGAYPPFTYIGFSSRVTGGSFYGDVCSIERVE